MEVLEPTMVDTTNNEDGKENSLSGQIDKEVVGSYVLGIRLMLIEPET